MSVPALPDDPLKKEEPLSAEEAAIEATRAPLMEHLVELRNRLFWSVLAILGGFFICFAFWQQLLLLLLRPYEQAVLAVKGKAALEHGMDLIYTAPLEQFTTQIKVALFGGIILAFPVIAFQLYRFVAPGLYSHEKKAFAPFLLMAPILFVAGLSMAYFVVIPMVMQFSLHQEVAIHTGGIGVVYQGKISEYVGMITTLVLAFGACFQLPVVQLLLARADLVGADVWFANARFAILGAFVLSAIVTPPDVISQLSLALPLVALYYLGAIMVKWTTPKANS